MYDVFVNTRRYRVKKETLNLIASTRFKAMADTFSSIYLDKRRNFMMKSKEDSFFRLPAGLLTETENPMIKYEHFTDFFRTIFVNCK